MGNFVCLSYLDVQHLGQVGFPVLGGLGVESPPRLPHEAGLEDVPAAPVLPEQAVVEVHGLARRLEVQRHWGTGRGGGFGMLAEFRMYNYTKSVKYLFYNYDTEILMFS